jgi:outer membrane receptor protein involved in Fe transport
MLVRQAIFAATALASSLAPLAARADDGGVDQVVVTANRTAQRREDVASSIEVVTPAKIQNTVALSFTDLLKKNAGVDVIQYPNGLAGVGLRGLRPDFEFSINPRTLTLIDGRPSGSTSFTTIAPEGIERVEVLKGPASALYGASAIGGVVNIITKRSKGPVAGQASVGYGSFDTWRADVSAGGSLTPRTDFDASFGYVDQGDDFKTGAGVKRLNSDYDRLSGRLRLGADLSDIIRVDGSIDGARLNNSAAGPYSFNPQTPSDTRLNRVGGDLRLSLTPENHRIALVGYASHDAYAFITINPATTAAAALRYRSSRTQADYGGAQLQDTWSILPNLSLTYGFDWQRLEVDRQAFVASGAGKAPSSPNEIRDTKALFAEASLRLLDDRLILTAGGREDWITAKTLATPLLTTFTPGSTDFQVFDPRGGVVFKLTDAWRLHATAGRAFAPPQGSQLAGQGEEIAGAQRRLTTGNPDLKPERNTTYDAGIGYASAHVAADLTYFDSETKGSIATVVLTNTPTLRQSTYVNANHSRYRGVEAAFDADAGAWLGLPDGRLSLSATATHLIKAQDVIAGVPTPVRNVADWKAAVSATVSDGGKLSATLTARYNGERWDGDNTQGFLYTGGKGGAFLYDTFTVVDLSTRWKATPRDTLRLDVSNLFDKAYYEKGDYPMPGRAIYARYARSF